MATAKVFMQVLSRYELSYKEHDKGISEVNEMSRTRMTTDQMFKDLQDMKFAVLSHYYDNEQLADAVLNTIHRATNAYMFNEDKEFKRLYKISKVIYGDFVHLHINKKVM